MSKVDDFIGQRFGEGGHLEVLPWDGEWHVEPRSGKREKRFKVFCSVCSQDPELHGDGVFSTLKGNLKKGRLPCGCSERHQLTMQQHEIKVRRICDERGYKVNKFLWGVDNDFTTKYVDLSCTLCGHSWDTTTISHLYSGSGCPGCRYIKTGNHKRKPEAEMIASFTVSGSFVEGTTFTRTTEKIGEVLIWNVTCPVCSIDEYVQAGLCSGVFPSIGPSLRQGQLACRCGKNHALTKQQMEYKIRKICAETSSHTFVRWDDEERFKVNDYIWLNCDVHGDWKVRVSHFTHTGSRCPDCAKTGYSKRKEGFIYVLKVECMVGNFTGYGISNKPRKRLVVHKRKLAKFGCSIVEQTIFKVAGDLAPVIETLIKHNFPRSAQEVEGFRTEATFPHLYEDVVKFVEQKILEFSSV